MRCKIMGEHMVASARGDGGNHQERRKLATLLGPIYGPPRGNRPNVVQSARAFDAGNEIDDPFCTNRFHRLRNDFEVLH